MAELVGVHASPITSIATDANCALLAIGDARGVVTLVDLAAGLIGRRSGVLGDGEGVGCMEPARASSGRGRGRGSGSGGGGDAAVRVRTRSGRATFDRHGRRPVAIEPRGASPPPASRFPGAEILCVASTESAVAFLDVARGTFLGTGSSGASGTSAQDPTHAEDPVQGARGGSVDDERDAAALDDARARSRRSPYRVDDGVVAVVQRGRDAIGEDEPARTSTSSTGGKMDRRASWARAAANEATAFVGVASAEAIRVYPATAPRRASGTR